MQELQIHEPVGVSESNEVMSYSQTAVVSVGDARIIQSESDQTEVSPDSCIIKPNNESGTKYGSSSTFATYSEEGRLDPVIARVAQKSMSGPSAVKQAKAMSSTVQTKPDKGDTERASHNMYSAPTHKAVEEALRRKQSNGPELVSGSVTPTMCDRSGTGSRRVSKTRPNSAYVTPDRPNTRVPMRSISATVRGSPGLSELSSPSNSMCASGVSASSHMFNLSKTNLPDKGSLTSEELQVMESKQKLLNEMKKFERIKATQGKKVRPMSAPGPLVSKSAPFPLESVVRHNAKMQQIKEAMANEAREMQSARVFVATSLEKVAKVVNQRHVPPKVERPNTVHKLFNIHTEQRHKYKQDVLTPEKVRLDQMRNEEQRLREEMHKAEEAEEIKRIRQEMEFKARKCTVTSTQPFRPNQMLAKEPTRFVPFALKTNQRMSGRAFWQDKRCFSELNI